MNKLNKEGKQKDFDHYLNKLRKWAQEAKSFDLFVARIKSFPHFYHGNPMLPEFTRWTLVDYQKLYEENNQ